MEKLPAEDQITIEEVKALLKRTKRMIHYYVRDGKLNKYRNGFNEVRYSYSEVMKLKREFIA